MKIAFFWFGMNGRYGKWQDGLYAAMKEIEKEHEVKYYDVTPKTLADVEEWKPDWVLFWEAPCTSRGEHAEMWYSVCRLPFKKALLFAGGPLKAMDVEPFDLVFVESEINAEECERQGIPHRTAFGTNTNIFFPTTAPKCYEAFMQATFAGWKRHELFADAMGAKGVVAGRKQQFDTNGYDRCVKRDVLILDEVQPTQVAGLINSSYVVLNTSDSQGGGQRCTLEAMACGVPVVVMSDSPKNCEFVRKYGCGVIAEPDVSSIQLAVALAKAGDRFGENGAKAVREHLTEKHYAKAIIDGLNSI